MYSLNKAGLLASAIVALLIITSCSDSGTSTTGVAPLSRDAAEAGAVNNAALKREDHDHGPQGHEAVGIAAPGQGEGLDHQHGEAGNAVTTTTVLALAAIPTSTCGNFIQEAGEQCDAGLSGSATCTANCELKTGKGGEIVAKSFCGNGTRDAGEECDDGNDGNEDSCTQYCKKAVCGDGYTQPSNGEQCDDKNKIDGDGCNNSCQKPDNVPTTITTVTETTDSDGRTTTNTVTQTTDSVGKTTKTEKTTVNTISGGDSPSSPTITPDTPSLLNPDQSCEDIQEAQWEVNDRTETKCSHNCADKESEGEIVGQDEISACYLACADAWWVKEFEIDEEYDACTQPVRCGGSC